MPWFPITDPARAGDIRMRRKRALMLLSVIVFVPWLMWSDRDANRARHREMMLEIPAIPLPPVPAIPAMPAMPEGSGEASQRFTAAALTIDLPCAESVSVQQDDSLNGQTVIAGDQSALDTVSIRNGLLTQRSGCPDDSHLVVRTARTVPLTLIQSGSNDLRVGSFDGPVEVTVSGSGDVRIDHAGRLVVNGNRSGDVSVGSVSGPVSAIMTGSGDLTIDGGTISALEADVHGSSDLNLGAVSVLSGRVNLGGSGDLSLASAQNSFNGELRGSGSLSISRVDLQQLFLRAYGSGDVKIGSGRIATMNAARYGSGDLSIAAEIGGGTLDHGGDGTVDIPRRGALRSTHD